MAALYLSLLVFVSGGAVLALEIVGTRVLGPFYGVSLFLWSALITVTLAALSVGYAVGGRWADRTASIGRLAGVVAAAGLWTLFIPLLQRPVLLVAEPFGLRVAVLVAAFLLFAPPLTLLGMVSPYAIRLRASSLGVVGRTAGNLYALSTLGSVAAALLTGFVLIPNVGVGRLLQLIGLTLIALVAAGFVLDPKMRTRPALPGLLVVAGLAAGALPSPSPATGSGVVAIRHSPYAEIRVVDARQLRHLLIDGGVHTIVAPDSWESRYPYAAVVGLARHFFDSPGRMLLVGLGGGSVVKDFAAHGWDVEAVEIDPVVVEVAREYFGLEPSEGRVHVQDGRRFLVDTPSRYDLIVMDAFGSSSIPFHLVTQESFGLVASRLAPDGVLALNIESPGWDSRIVRSFAATLETQFAHVLALPTFRSPQQLGNIVLLASQRELVLRRPLERNLARGARRHRIFAWDNRIEPETTGAPRLTDDLNPVDVWSERINLEARKGLHEYFEEGVGW